MGVRNVPGHEPGHVPRHVPGDGFRHVAGDAWCWTALPSRLRWPSRRGRAGSVSSTARLPANTAYVPTLLTCQHCLRANTAYVPKTQPCAATPRSHGNSGDASVELRDGLRSADDERRHVCRHMYRHVCRHVGRHVYRHVYRHV